MIAHDATSLDFRPASPARNSFFSSAFPFNTSSTQHTFGGGGGGGPATPPHNPFKDQEALYAPGPGQAPVSPQYLSSFSSGEKPSLFDIITKNTAPSNSSNHQRNNNTPSGGSHTREDEAHNPYRQPSRARKYFTNSTFGEKHAGDSGKHRDDYERIESLQRQLDDTNRYPVSHLLFMWHFNQHPLCKTARPGLAWQRQRRPGVFLGSCETDR